MTESTAPEAVAALETVAALEAIADREARMAWWREARLGMFVHWGLYSVAAGTWRGRVHETCSTWLQFWAGIPTQDYAQALTPGFRPMPGFATAWARLARAMGARYVVMTVKHHEGFALWNSAASDFHAHAVTGRDLVREVVTALRAEGLRVGFYVSVIDWHHPDFPSFGTGLPHPGERMSPAAQAARGTQGSWDRYVEFLHRQVEELVTQYGRIDILWWDFSSAATQGERWRAQELMAMVRRAQPHVVMNNRLYDSPNLQGDNLAIFDRAKGDFTTPEQHVPATGMPGVDWETCMTVNGSWGWKGPHDLAWKSAKELVRTTIEVASKGGNHLLNLGPMPDGTIPEEIRERFHALGAWMQVHGEAIYGTMASPVGAVPWGHITAKPGTWYALLDDGESTVEVIVPVPASRVVGARMLADPRAQPLPWRAVEAGIAVSIDPAWVHPLATVVAIALATTTPSAGGA